MYKLEITTRVWDKLKQRLHLDCSMFTESANNDETVVVFNDLSSMSNVFQKIADHTKINKEQDQSIWESYLRIKAKGFE